MALVHELFDTPSYVIVTCKYGKDPRKSGNAVFPIIIKSMGIFSDAKGHLTQPSVVRSGQTLNSSELSCMSSLPASKRLIKNSREKVATPFSPLYPMGAICCHGNQSSDQIWPKTLCSLSPTQMMLQMKFDCD